MTLHGAFPALFGAETSFDDDDLGFTAVISTSGDGITLSVRGRDGDVYRTVSMDFNLVSGGSGVFDYALASKGGIKMVGRSAILGANSPSEANVLSAATTGNKTFTLTGNACIEGDVYSPNAAASAQLSGNISIGGEPRSSEAILDHIHIGIEDQDCDREGRPRKAEVVNVRCPQTGRPMVRRTGRFGPFLATQLRDGEDPQKVGLILNIDKKGQVNAPSQPPLETDLPCPKCGAALNLRNGVRGPWLGCSKFPKCRGRGKWAELDEAKQAELEAALAEHDRKHPIPIIRTLDGRELTDAKGKPLPDAPTVEALMIDPDEAEEMVGDEAKVA